jgi:hypothetical protein
MGHIRGPGLRRTVVVVAAALVAAALLPVAVPRAWATLGETVQRAGLVLLARSLGERLPVPEDKAPAAASGSGGAVRAEFVPLDDVRRRVDFPVCAPTWLPAGLHVVGAYSARRDAAAVRFAPAPGSSAGGGIQQTLGPQKGGYAVPADRAEPTRVRGQPATFARGTWTKDRQWDAAADAALLSWEENGVTYLLGFSGLGLSRDEVLRIAESCR